VNVRACDAFVCVLSQRYGATVEKFGYAKVSATELEYLEAKKFDRPIWLYVRDQLASELGILLGAALAWGA
jgi:hypothetical protein